jgi:hypothetical protein
MIAAVLTLLMVGQQPKIETSYDRFRDLTTVGVLTDGIQQSAKTRISFGFYCFVKGSKPGPVAAEEQVYLVVHSASDRRQFQKLHDIHILAGGKRYEGEEDYDGNIEDKVMIETVTVPIDFADFEKIAGSPVVEIAIGSVEVKLTDEQIATARRFAARLKLDAAGLEKLAKEEAAAEKKKAQEADEAKRRPAAEAVEPKKRQAALKDQLRTELATAIKEAKQIAARREPAVRKRVYQITLDNKINSLARDFGVTAEDIKKMFANELK